MRARNRPALDWLEDGRSLARELAEQCKPAFLISDEELALVRVAVRHASSSKQSVGTGLGFLTVPIRPKSRSRGLSTTTGEATLEGLQRNRVTGEPSSGAASVLIATVGVHVHYSLY